MVVGVGVMMNSGASKFIITITAFSVYELEVTFSSD